MLWLQILSLIILATILTPVAAGHKHTARSPSPAPAPAPPITTTPTHHDRLLCNTAGTFCAHVNGIGVRVRCEDRYSFHHYHGGVESDGESDPDRDGLVTVTVAGAGAGASTKPKLGLEAAEPCAEGTRCRRDAYGVARCRRAPYEETGDDDGGSGGDNGSMMLPTTDGWTDDRTA